VVALDKGMRMMSEDMKQSQVVVQRGSGVSSALWPASAQKCVATSKEAQRRRYMIIKGKRWAALAGYSSVSLSLVLIVVISMLMSGAVVAALIWHLWYMVLVAVLLLPLLLNARAKTEVRSLLTSLRRATQAKAIRSTREMQGKQVLAAKSMDRLHIQVAPRTPMPEESLVRVLETVDLSQSSVEHFVGSDAESKERGDGEGDTRERDTAALILNLKAELAHAKNVK
jgi:hypothetical protein